MRKGWKFLKKLRCCVGGGKKVIWLYQLSWKCKLATVTSYKADVSSVRLSLWRRANARNVSFTTRYGGQFNFQLSWYNQILGWEIWRACIELALCLLCCNGDQLRWSKANKTNNIKWSFWQIVLIVEAILLISAVRNVLIIKENFDVGHMA